MKTFGKLMDKLLNGSHERICKLADREFDAIIELFNRKGKSYGANNDVFHNFRMTAIRLYGRDTWDAMFRVAEIYKDKHNVALAKGIDVPEARERLRDNILYSLFQLAMIDEYEKEEKSDCY